MSSTASLSTSSDDFMDPFASLYQTQPEIWHIFRPSEKRPNSVLALVFTLLSIIPLLALIYQLLSTRIFTSLQLPTSTREFIAAMIFQGSIICICMIFVLYWLQLNIFQALTLIGIISIITVFSGVEALRSVHLRTHTIHKKVE